MYTFTCPLEGCEHKVMKSSVETVDEAAPELMRAAELHLDDMHPGVHKSHEEISQDIRAHMVKSEQ